MIVHKNGRSSLFAKILGDMANNYEIESDVKAITYNEMFVKKEKGIDTCQAIVDV